MTELEKIISAVYTIIDQMAVTGQNQELAVMAKSQLRKAKELARGEENGGK